MNVQTGSDGTQQNAVDTAGIKEEPKDVILHREETPEVVDPPADEPKATETEQESNTPEDGAKPRKNSVQDRIDELTRQKHESARQAEYWRQVATAKQAEAPAVPERPKAADFKDYDEYLEALTDWKTDRAVEKLQAGVSKGFEQERAVQTEAARAQTFVQRQQAATSRYPDYVEVVGASDLPIHPHIMDAVLDSEHGPDLTYRFAKDPALLERLNGMSPAQANREIGRLEATFASAHAEPAKKVSNAPKPAPTGVQSGSGGQVKLADAGMDDYIAARRAQGARWAR